MACTLIRRTEFADFEALRACLPNGGAEVVQLESGPMTGSLTDVALGDRCQLKAGMFSRGILTRGIITGPLVRSEIAPTRTSP